MNETEFRPLINPDSKMKPVKQLFVGYEIEKRFLLLTPDEDFSKKKNATKTYDEVLKDGVVIEQGYIKDIQMALKMLENLGINLNEFKPNTIRLRKFGEGYKQGKISPHKYILTLKDRKETKKREAEFKLKESIFEKWWPETKGARISKKRLKKEISGRVYEFDAFLDRYLLLVECEVQSEDELDKVKKLGMDITGDKNWTNKNLSK